MRLNRSALLLIIFFLVLSNRVIGQCFPVDGNIDIYDLENQPDNVLTLTGSTDGAANTFAIPDCELSGLQFLSSDIIYEMVIEVGDTFNLFFDLETKSGSLNLISLNGVSVIINKYLLSWSTKLNIE